jgi:hypothetical protein
MAPAREWTNMISCIYLNEEYGEPEEPVFAVYNVQLDNPKGLAFPAIFPLPRVAIIVDKL